jgi:hypothetical protein
MSNTFFLVLFVPGENGLEAAANNCFIILLMSALFFVLELARMGHNTYEENLSYFF